MAAGEVTGATAREVLTLRGQYYNTPLWLDHEVPFDTAYCLTRIGKQPDDYDGPDRYCQRRAKKIEDYDGHPHDEAAYAPSCPFHGGTNNAENNLDNLENPYTAGIKHGVWAEDEHLQMDFNDAEQALYDSIMETWPEVYEWPPEEQDPARYQILDFVATNIVRSNRCEDYLDDDGEVHLEPVFDDQGVEVGEKEVENPLAREYRLLVSEIMNMLRELGLTPKERQKMDTLESEENANDAVAEIAGDALADSDEDYDPDQFDDA